VTSSLLLLAVQTFLQTEVTATTSLGFQPGGRSALSTLLVKMTGVESDIGIAWINERTL
jgi:hypothetical protein